MSTIIVTKTDTSEVSFPPVAGPYTKSLRFDGGFAIIEDEQGKRTIFPGTAVAQIVVEQ